MWGSSTTSPPRLAGRAAEGRRRRRRHRRAHRLQRPPSLRDRVQVGRRRRVRQRRLRRGRARRRSATAAAGCLDCSRRASSAAPSLPSCRKIARRVAPAAHCRSADGWHVTMALESPADGILRARRRPAFGFRRAVLASSAVDGASGFTRQLRVVRPICWASSAVSRSRSSSPLPTRVPWARRCSACRHRDHLRRGARRRALRKASPRVARGGALHRERLVPVDDDGRVPAARAEHRRRRLRAVAGPLVAGRQRLCILGRRGRLLVDRFGAVAGRLGMLALWASAAGIAGDSASRLASRSPSPGGVAQRAAVGAVIGGNPRAALVEPALVDAALIASAG